VSVADVVSEEHDRVVIVTVRGEIDMSNADALRTELERHVENEALGAVVDLSAVDYIDSTGIQLLYQLSARLETRGQALRVVVGEGSVVADTLRYASALDLLGGGQDGVEAAAADIRG